MNTTDLRPGNEELMDVYRRKYFQAGEPGWGPKLRLSFGYFAADDHYEALVSRLVQEGTVWADVGCGRDIFPQNRPMAAELCERARYVLGIDPDPNIHDNELVSEKFHGTVEQFQGDMKFDLITLRMVAEHIVHPEVVCAKLASMLRPRGRVVIYTPNKWSPVSLLAAVIPFRLHNPIKRVFWKTEARDTFPTAYRMNTREELRALFQPHDLYEEFFEYVDDCSVTAGFKPLNVVELSVRSVFRRLNLRYPENCLLAVYRKR